MKNHAANNSSGVRRTLSVELRSARGFGSCGPALPYLLLRCGPVVAVIGHRANHGAAGGAARLRSETDRTAFRRIGIRADRPGSVSFADAAIRTAPGSGR